MAEIRLGRAEVERGRLPKVCMVCGARASVKRKKAFKWYPPWAWWVGGIILASIMSKSMRINAPLCHEHRNHWLMRTLLIILGFVGVVALGATCLFIAAAKSGANGGNDKPIAIAGGLTVILFVAWIILLVVLQQTAIRAKEITDRSMTLIGVNKKFISALRELREERRSETAEARPSARRRPVVEEGDSSDDEDD